MVGWVLWADGSWPCWGLSAGLLQSWTDRWQLGKYVGGAAGGLPQWEVAWRTLIRANLAGNVGEAS